MSTSMFDFLGAGYCIATGLLALSFVVRRPPHISIPLRFWRVSNTLSGLGLLIPGGLLALGFLMTQTSIPPLVSALWAFSFICLLIGGTTLGIGSMLSGSRRRPLLQREPPHDA
jgi:hypothetical protein